MLRHIVSSQRSSLRIHVFICAWCRKRIVPGPKPADAIVNWGMCRRCLRHELAALPAAAGPFATGKGPEGPDEADGDQLEQLPAA